GYRRLLTEVEKWRTLVIVLVALVTLAGLALLPFLKTEFLPRLNENNYVVHLALVPGSSLKQSIAIGNRITAELRKIPYIQQVVQRAGKPALAGDVRGPQYSAYQIRVKSLTSAQARKFRADMNQLIIKFPGVLLSYNSCFIRAYQSSHFRFPRPGGRAGDRQQVCGPSTGIGHVDSG
ncbi:Acriflavin resistance protein, partial [mine drainage metagenome]